MVSLIMFMGGTSIYDARARRGRRVVSPDIPREVAWRCAPGGGGQFNSKNNVLNALDPSLVPPQEEGGCGGGGGLLALAAEAPLQQQEESPEVRVWTSSRLNAM